VADVDRTRLEIAFDGGQGLTVFVAASAADDVDRALAGGAESVSFDAEDGRYTIAIRKVAFVKRYARETRVGFGAVG
jgi:hypothetical protein